MRTRVGFQKISKCYQNQLCPAKLHSCWGEQEVQLGLAVKGAGQQVLAGLYGSLLADINLTELTVI